MKKIKFNEKTKLIILIIVIFIIGIGIGVLGGVKYKELLLKKYEFNKVIQKEEQKRKEIIINEFEEESATISVVKNTSRSVVSIIVKKELKDLYSRTGNIDPFNDFFRFDSRFDVSKNLPKGKHKVGGGTGFIISQDGLILTNKHVISETDAEYTVITNNDKKYDAKVLAIDPFLDIAILKIKAENLQVLKLGDSDKIQIGQTVIAIGNTLSEFRNTVTKGVISGIGRKVVAGNARGQSEVLEEAIQTDAAINPGNSGGPLLNLKGEVIGINTAISQKGQLVGFSIPINSVKKAIKSVKKHGKIIRPWLGVRYIILNKRIAELNKLRVKKGALIVRGNEITDFAVIPGSPADKAGLLENDIILEVNSKVIDEKNTLAKEISKYNPEDEVKLKVLSKGKEKIVKVKLNELDI